MLPVGHVPAVVQNEKVDFIVLALQAETGVDLKL